MVSKATLGYGVSGALIASCIVFVGTKQPILSTAIGIYAGLLSASSNRLREAEIKNSELKDQLFLSKGEVASLKWEVHQLQKLSPYHLVGKVRDLDIKAQEVTEAANAKVKFLQKRIAHIQENANKDVALIESNREGTITDLQYVVKGYNDVLQIAEQQPQSISYVIAPADAEIEA